MKEFKKKSELMDETGDKLRQHNGALMIMKGQK
jgi:hypothetical protein